MSIILKGIDLPKDTFGVKVTFQCYSEDNTFGTMIISHTEEQYVMFDDIIQIPKGARLIDANELSKEVEIEIEDFLTESGIRSVIRNAPTILEEEEDCD